MDIDIREPTPGDYLTIGHNLRPEDEREIAGLSGIPPVLVVKASIEVSNWCRVVAIDGNASIVFGTSREVGCEDYGNVWMMSTPGIYKVRRRFLRESKEWVKCMFDSGPFNRMHNVADMRNDLHIKWLRWLGAEFDGDRIKKHYERFEIRR